MATDPGESEAEQNERGGGKPTDDDTEPEHHCFLRLVVGVWWL